MCKKYTICTTILENIYIRFCMHLLVSVWALRHHHLRTSSATLGQHAQTFHASVVYMRPNWGLTQLCIYKKQLSEHFHTVTSAFKAAENLTV